MLRLLWNHRERLTFASFHWWKTWTKRLVTAPRLLESVVRQAGLRWRGAQIESPVFIAPIIRNGPARNLVLGSGSFLGRVELHLHDRVSIGRNVVINDGVRLLTASHDVQDADFRHVKAPILIGDHAWIATGAILLPGVTVGAGAVIGAGAVVARDVPEYGIAVGNPARLLDKKRQRVLRYQPVRLVAAFEAWLGQT